MTAPRPRPRIARPCADTETPHADQEKSHPRHLTAPKTPPRPSVPAGRGKHKSRNRPRTANEYPCTLLFDTAKATTPFTPHRALPPQALNPPNATTSKDTRQSIGSGARASHENTALPQNRPAHRALRSTEPRATTLMDLRRASRTAQATAWQKGAAPGLPGRSPIPVLFWPKRA